MADFGGMPPKFPRDHTPFCAAACFTAFAACGPWAPLPIRCICCISWWRSLHKINKSV